LSIFVKKIIKIYWTESYQSIITHLQVTGRPSCGRGAIAVASYYDVLTEHCFKQCVIAVDGCTATNRL